MRKTNIKAKRRTTLVTWCVDWCVDQCVSWWADVEPPKWLRAAVRRNAAFRESRDELDAFTDKLKRDAHPWAKLTDAKPSSKRVGGETLEDLIVAPSRAALKPDVGTHSASARSQRLRLVAGIVTTAAVVALLLWRSDSLSDRHSDPKPPPIVAEEQSESVLADEMQALAKVVEQSWDSSEAYAGTISSSIDEPFPLVSSQSIGNFVSQRVRSFSRSYGRSVDFLARRSEELNP